MVATADGQDGNNEASGPRSVEFIHRIAASQSPAEAARHVFQVPHLQIRDCLLELFTMARELSERIVASLGACKEEELRGIDKKLRDCLDAGAGLKHWFHGLETGRWIRKTMSREWGLEREH
jgi:hypothetical protein